MRGEGRRSTLGQGLVYAMNTDAAELYLRDFVSLHVCSCLMFPVIIGYCEGCDYILKIMERISERLEPKNDCMLH